MGKKKKQVGSVYRAIFIHDLEECSFCGRWTDKDMHRISTHGDMLSEHEQTICEICIIALSRCMDNWKEGVKELEKSGPFKVTDSSNFELTKKKK